VFIRARATVGIAKGEVKTSQKILAGSIYWLSVELKGLESQRVCAYHFYRWGRAQRDAYVGLSQSEIRLGVLERVGAGR